MRYSSTPIRRYPNRGRLPAISCISLRISTKSGGRSRRTVFGSIPTRLQAPFRQICFANRLSGSGMLRDIMIRITRSTAFRRFIMLSTLSQQVFQTKLSSMVSANRRLSLAFPFSIAFSLAASDTSMPVLGLQHVEGGRADGTPQRSAFPLPDS